MTSSGARLWASCQSIAESKTLLADMERLVHRMGLVGEGAAIRGTYIAGSSRLLRRLAISFLRRGAAASGKNVQINKVLDLFPEKSVIRITSATPQALIYEGEDENDVDALKHKIIVIEEAAILGAQGERRRASDGSDAARDIEQRPSSNTTSQVGRQNLHIRLIIDHENE